MKNLRKSLTVAILSEAPQGERSKDGKKTGSALFGTDPSRLDIVAVVRLGLEQVLKLHEHLALLMMPTHWFIPGCPMRLLVIKSGSDIEDRERAKAIGEQGINIDCLSEIIVLEHQSD